MDLSSVSVGDFSYMPDVELCMLMCTDMCVDAHGDNCRATCESMHREVNTDLRADTSDGCVQMCAYK